MAVMKLNASFSPDHYFAALKLIEQLYTDGKIPAYLYRNIINDYADTVDLSQFTIYDEQEEAA